MAEGQVDNLLAELEQSVKTGLAFFQGPGGQSHVQIGTWHPREVLCVLMWWHQVTAEGMEAVASGGAPYRIYASVDEMNARAVGRAASKNIAQMAELVQGYQDRIAKAAKALPDPNATVMVFGDGTSRSAIQRLETVAKHWREKVQQLQTLGAA
ncbi:MAG: hypothetical protein AB7N91_20190 [Candidatus Tectimicrobiota bacterium]